MRYMHWHFALPMHADIAFCWVCVHGYDHSSFLVMGGELGNGTTSKMSLMVA